MLRLNINPYTACRRSPRQPIVDPNMVQLCDETTVERADHFRFVRDWQAHTTELLFYDCALGEVVEYGYPAYNSERILPHCIQLYNNKRQQKFECFCGQYSPSAPVFANIYTVCEGQVQVAYASCHTCGLSVSFNEKFSTAIRQKVYPGFHKDSETMGVPSRPEDVPRDLAVTLPYRPCAPPRVWQPLVVALGLHRTRTHTCTPSSASRHTANRGRYVTPPNLNPLEESIPPSASSVVNRYLGKAPTRAPSRFMTLDSPSLSVMEGAIAGPSCFTGSIESLNSSSSKVKAEDEDVLVFCPKCYRYLPIEHTCFHKNFSPEL
ncbi:hypothetical protein M422DRAFT_259669 [Sphaerobolus stellatus SS14]|uniref:Uncharacterized protein n=1 Tax=Sphaerobolus stellatus (strain SS14) TaxID=990650 RepID=A0A0C9VK45_SPHS4|nr:hypothetical protein M422DRAFT_259669 [Sphaerobolus stellatus SS14]